MAPSTPIMQALTAAMNSNPAQKREDAHYEPRIQHYFTTSKDGRWQSASKAPISAAAVPASSINPKTIRLISWNIDVLVGFAEERMRSALEYLDTLVSSAPTDIPVVIFLQEMCQSDLSQIQNTAWVKSRFHLTDLDNTHWLSPLYGTTTLIDRRLQIKSVFRVPWISKFDRDGLFVDLVLSNPSSSTSSKNSKTTSVLRLCNTHLESLVADPPIRPLQLAAAAPYLHDKNVASALLAGDLNAIQPFDRTLHTDNKLTDTYLELGGQEDSHEGYTWGYQVPQWMKDKFGCSRMDKILLRGDVKPVRFERVGMGVKVGGDVLEEVSKEIEGGWVTDHYGVMGDFEVTGGWELSGLEVDGDEVRARLA